MAAPSFVDAGTGATDATGAWAYTCQASGAAGRVFIVHVFQDGTTNAAVTDVVGTNIESLDGTDNTWTKLDGPLANDTWAVGASEEALTHIFIGRALSTSAPTISGANSTSEDLYIRSYQFSDVITVAMGADTLAEVLENATAGAYVTSAGTDATATDAGVTTLGPDRLALNFVAVNDDNVIPDFTSETGGDWTLAVSPYAESSGTDGAIGLQAAYPAILDLDYTSTSVLTPEAIGAAAGIKEQLAQSFVASGASLTSVSAYLDRDGSPTDNIIFEVQTDNAGVPSGTVVGTSVAVAASTISLTGALYTFEVRAPLTASTTYWIVGRRSGAFDAGAYIRWWYSATSYEAGARAVFNGTSWTASGSDKAFASYFNAAGTIDGGSASITDSDAWGAVGFALIGTTVAAAYVPRHPAHDHGSVTIF